MNTSFETFLQKNLNNSISAQSDLSDEYSMYRDNGMLEKYLLAGKLPIDVESELRMDDDPELAVYIHFMVIIGSKLSMGIVQNRQKDIDLYDYYLDQVCKFSLKLEKLMYIRRFISQEEKKKDDDIFGDMDSLLDSLYKNTMGIFELNVKPIMRGELYHKYMGYCHRSQDMFLTGIFTDSTDVMTTDDSSEDSSDQDSS